MENYVIRHSTKNMNVLSELALSDDQEVTCDAVENSQNL